MSKSPDAFRTISEVSRWLDVPAHVLRFWESKFPQVKPVKRAGGRRYYRPSDMALLSGIKTLLYDEGMTIRGVQKRLREGGVRAVSALGTAPGDAAAFDSAALTEIPDEAEPAAADTPPAIPDADAQPDDAVIPFRPATPAFEADHTPPSDETTAAPEPASTEPEPASEAAPFSPAPSDEPQDADAAEPATAPEPLEASEATAPAPDLPHADAVEAPDDPAEPPFDAEEPPVDAQDASETDETALDTETPDTPEPSPEPEAAFAPPEDVAPLRDAVPAAAFESTEDTAPADSPRDIPAAFGTDIPEDPPRPGPIPQQVAAPGPIARLRERALSGEKPASRVRLIALQGRIRRLAEQLGPQDRDGIEN